ncbi:MAG TPA: phosphoglucosamine mutase [Candidatus Diapherotrites archaeon]|uniref:Phosphoglucosamine mutase n=1 Tax=Candidatus Iainarchaeum sp. TaxID=3101447 RepID=A0A7J4JL44_9ARCH|nr:phosphoglucosamine mutase [Candidatus Diapherotrites archaeon]HIH16637.1 phosphoglucosamine mutase [Candidatus Diapherotrites archaeon]
MSSLNDNGNGKIFGTDGIRGKANVYPMTPEIALRVGKAVATVLQRADKKRQGKPKIVIGKDTRLSGYMLETALTSGIVSQGAHVFLVGPMPTPAIAHLTKSMNADAGIVISASHNPAHDNGIKVFDHAGYKLGEDLEDRIEQLVNSNGFDSGEVTGNDIGKAFRIDDARGRYIEFCKSSIDNLSLQGLKVVLDCANGAAYHIAPYIFSELGAQVVSLNTEPDGLNINLNCGALHPEQMQREVRRQKADLGIALDGDADRIIVCDEKGKLVDGDHLLALMALDLKAKGKLARDTVVSTVMANLGFHEAMRQAGLQVKVTQVGDKYVIDEMRRGGFVLGGEQSGHLVFHEYSTTGDGIITGLQLLRLLCEKRQPLSRLARCMKAYPQVLVNLKVREKRPFEAMEGVQERIHYVEGKLGSEGRVLVRYSGTENLARVMIEGKHQTEISKLAQSIASEIRKVIGA